MSASLMPLVAARTSETSRTPSTASPAPPARVSLNSFRRSKVGREGFSTRPSRGLLMKCPPCGCGRFGVHDSPGPDRRPIAPRCRRIPRSSCRSSDLAEFVQELGDETCPPGLMAGAETGSRVAVKILVEEHEIPPVRVVVEERVRARDRPPARGVGQEDPREAAGELAGNLLQIHHLSRARRTLDLERRTEVAMVAAQRLDEQVVDGE